ncbi:MAG: hypothetical protein WB697_16685, partial [Stellaceae bacterium]
MLLSFRDTDAPTIIIAEKDAVMIKDAARESLRLNCGARRGGRYLGPGGAGGTTATRLCRPVRRESLARVTESSNLSTSKLGSISVRETLPEVDEGGPIVFDAVQSPGEREDMRRLLIALCLLSAMSGCQAVNEAVSNSVSAGQPINQNDQEIALYQSFITPDRIRECLGQPRGSGERQSCRDLITYARLKYADLNYDRFRRKLFETVNGGNTAADLTILGLGSAGALVPGATTKAILAAISAGISGGKGIIDRDLLYNA